MLKQVSAHRILRLRRKSQPVNWRTFFLPRGLNINRLNIHIKPPPPPVEPGPLAPTFWELSGPRRQRRSRLIGGPDIGPGGRRLDSGEQDEGEELPEYKADVHLPCYAPPDNPDVAVVAPEANFLAEVTDYENRTRIQPNERPPGYVAETAAVDRVESNLSGSTVFVVAAPKPEELLPPTRDVVVSSSGESSSSTSDPSTPAVESLPAPLALAHPLETQAEAVARIQNENDESRNSSHLDSATGGP